jgi:hydroxyethylthiazole kinase-like uncharacterized protein yjeF
MLKAVSAKEMKSIDARAIRGMGIPGVVLMENAGRGVVSCMREEIGELAGLSFSIVCGKGNNGGDGFVVARFLQNEGASVESCLLGRKSDVRGDARANLDLALKAGVKVTEVRGEKSLSSLVTSLERADAALDAIFGTGFEGVARGIPAKAIGLLNEFEGPVFSVDVPSGLDATTGQVEGPCVIADVTATMCLPKTGLLLYPGRSYAGDLYVVDIGVPSVAIRKENVKLEVLDTEYVRSILPLRPSGAHKGRFGHLLVVAGSPGMTGAAALASMSALRAGCGLVTLAVPESLNDVMEVKLTEVMTLPVPETKSRTFAPEAVAPILSFLKKADALALGPGIGTDAGTRDFVLGLLPRVKCPAVVDADGLNNISSDTRVLGRSRSPLVLTPHPGEASRLTGVGAAEIDRGRVEYAARIAEKFSVTVALKGAPTVVANPAGFKVINPTGNSGMATGGSGDVLTGMIGGFLAQGLEPFEATSISVYLHGLAGDLGAEEKTEYSLVAGDIMDAIPLAVKECTEESVD